MRAWIDVDNPPQVQYLVPFKAAFEALGAETVVTARDYGETLKLLDAAGIEATVFGERTGRGTARKAIAVLDRAYRLRALFARTARPDVLLCASRASAIAARSLGIPSFVFGDYEYADVSVSRWLGSTLLHPDCIDQRAFIGRGLSASQLVRFRGIKEDITFAGVDVDAVAPHDLGDAVAPDAVRVLFRPPSESSHYYSEASTSMADATLRHLAGIGAQVVFSPRTPVQARGLEGLPWQHEPIVLREPVPFVALLKSVDAVVCSGGTMLREAAYLGIPAYSIFRSRMGGVDRWLETIGRVAIIRSAEELPDRMRPVRRDGGLDRLDSNPHLIDELVRIVTAGARRDVVVPA